MTIHLMIRGFLGHKLQFERLTVMEEEKLDTLVPDLGAEHAAAMAAGTLDMVEIEFLDEPDPNQRFFRIGTNPAGMVIPIGINL